MSIIEKLSTRLIAAHAHGELLPKGLLQGQSLDEDQAYRIQRVVNRHHAPTFRGWKTGVLGNGNVFTAPVRPEMFLPDQAQLDGQHFASLHVEAELAYRFSQDFPAGVSHDPQQVLAAVDQIAVAIEVLDSRLADWENESEMLHLADNQMNGALVIGSGLRHWQQLDYKTQPVELYINGEMVVQDRGSHPQQDPTTLLAEFVNQCSKRGYDLIAGSWVTTGTWSGYPRAQAGDRVHARFPGIGEASLYL